MSTRSITATIVMARLPAMVSTARWGARRRRSIAKTAHKGRANRTILPKKAYTARPPWLPLRRFQMTRRRATWPKADADTARPTPTSPIHCRPA